ncbi:MAG: hypothetical protein JRI23_27075 [Deltaproteobacteria bacterium]|jgi:hypothetical protein|nr:hypothetical protein [Deltaproteobacteria bacterium]MBW2535745.1 hypothetical protein [Deltaproteobacteria bacterium]
MMGTPAAAPPAPRLPACLACGLALGLLASAARADDAGATEALLHDVRKLVGAQEDTGWLIDRYEIEDLMSHTLFSVCQVSPAVRAAALARAERTVAKLGGPLEQALDQGREKEELGDLITATRVRDVLREATSRARRDCPVHITEDPDFRGVQTDARRLTLNLELGGLLVAQRSSGESNIGGGGSGRLLLAYGIDHTFTVLFGGEMGGNALFRRGDEQTQFPIQLVAAAPVVLRAHRGTFLHDLELAPLVLFTDEEQPHPSYGFRVGGLLGLSTFRIHNIMPWAGIGLAFEYVFENDHRPQILSAKGGGRVGFDWDF